VSLIVKEQKRLEELKRMELLQQQTKVAVLEKKKEKLEQTLDKIDSEVAKETSNLKRAASIREKAKIQETLQEVKSEIVAEKSEAQRLESEYEDLSAEIAEFQERLNDLNVLNERLHAENQSQLEQAKSTQKELDEITELYEIEAAQRQALEDYIMQLKGEILSLSAMKPSKAAEAVEEIPVAEHVEPPSISEQEASEISDVVAEVLSRLNNFT
jgi:chromosome segregation ATPase